MDVSEKMKYKLANAMKELLVRTPVDKITVKQIVPETFLGRIFPRKWRWEELMPWSIRSKLLNVWEEP